MFFNFFPSLLYSMQFRMQPIHHTTKLIQEFELMVAYVVFGTKKTILKGHCCQNWFLRVHTVDYVFQYLPSLHTFVKFDISTTRLTENKKKSQTKHNLDRFYLMLSKTYRQDIFSFQCFDSCHLEVQFHSAIFAAPAHTERMCLMKDV